MFRKIYRMVFGKFIKSGEKISLFQLRAVNKVDRISKGEKTPVVHYPREEKFLKEMSKDVKIREKIDKKYDQLLKNADQITITSTDPPEIPKSKRNLPKREWEYDIENSKYEYEYGFYEPPVEKIEENRLMFREALEILRARMELESVPEEARDKHQATSLLESHPALKRVEKTKLDTMWNFFRPFAVCEEQNIARSYDMENILSFAQGYGPRQLTNAQVFAELQRASRHLPHDGGVVHDESTEMVPDFETKSKEKGEKETERLESSLRELFKVEKSSNQTSGNKKE
uniref:Uncharacterized protein n=1 Tax=Meloidogyne enterolobii TaxID=390850 RepID=A0A6V7TQK0_MELEN|nr:unnamed protein product [Meloidogyne enterolobii]